MCTVVKLVRGHGNFPRRSDQNYWSRPAVVRHLQQGFPILYYSGVSGKMHDSPLVQFVHLRMWWTNSDFIRLGSVRLATTVHATQVRMPFEEAALHRWCHGRDSYYRNYNYTRYIADTYMWSQKRCTVQQLRARQWLELYVELSLCKSQTTYFINQRATSGRGDISSAACLHASCMIYLDLAYMPCMTHCPFVQSCKLLAQFNYS